jgi:hypothetical protein
VARITATLALRASGDISSGSRSTGIGPPGGCVGPGWIAPSIYLHTGKWGEVSGRRWPGIALPHERPISYNISGFGRYL